MLKLEVRITLKNRDQIEAVSRMQNYIKEHLHEIITLRNLSEIAGYSPWHCARIFKEHTGKTPFEYIRTLRLSKAALILRDEKVKVIDVAFDFVFDSHEGFTRAFSKEFGMSPRKYAKETPPVKLFMPYPVHEYYRYLERSVEKMDKQVNANTVFVQVVDRPQRKLIIKRGEKAKDYFAYCEEVGCDVWGILSSVKEALNEPMGLWLPNNLVKPGTSVYVQGVEVPKDYKGEVPEGFDLIDLKPCKMMIFQGAPYDDEVFMEEIAELWRVIKEYDPTLYGFEWADDDGPRFQLEPQGYRGYIEGKPVRLINKD